MTKKKNRDRFKPQKSQKTRSANSRQERHVKDEAPLMLFSFKDYRGNQQGQNYAEWQAQNLLASLMDKCGQICNCNRIEAENQGFIKVYREFPKKSEFENPFPDVDLNWAVIMKIGGQKPRAVGYVDGNVFYVVFLDAEHQFYPSSKKNT